MTLGTTIDSLPPLALAVLEQLPAEPGGVSIFELACGQYDTDEPSYRQEQAIRHAVEHVGRVLGGLYSRQRDDASRSGHRCMTVGVPAVAMEQVRQHFKEHPDGR